MKNGKTQGSNRIWNLRSVKIPCSSTVETRSKFDFCDGEKEFFGFAVGVAIDISGLLMLKGHVHMYSYTN